MSYHVPNTEIFSFFSPLKVLSSLNEIISKKPQGVPVFDVAFIDISMPEMDGYALCKELRKALTEKDLNQKETKFVAVTAMDQLENEMQDNGFDGLLSKPIDPDEMTKWFA